jgi:hypothetical protein
VEVVDHSPGESEDVSHGDSDALAVQGVGTPRAEQQGTGGSREAGEGPKQATDIVRIRDLLKREDHAGAADTFPAIVGGGAHATGEDPAVELEARDLLNDRDRGDEHGGVHSGKDRGHEFGPLGGHEQAVKLQAGVDQLLHDPLAFGDEVGEFATELAGLTLGVNETTVVNEGGLVRR